MNARWLDNEHAIAPDDPIFRSALKSNLLLMPLSRAVSNARNKDPAVMRGIGEVIELQLSADRPRDRLCRSVPVDRTGKLYRLKVEKVNRP